MHEHRTIPQRLSDHDAILDAQAQVIVELLERVSVLEAAAEPPIVPVPPKDRK